MNFALTFFPLDIATVAILMCVCMVVSAHSFSPIFTSLSWADTAASTFGRLWGRYTPPLPTRMPLLRLPLAPRKSLAGFIAASVTGGAIAASFWAYVAPIRPTNISWTYENGVSDALRMASPSIECRWNGGGWLGLAAITVTAGIVSGVAEALGE